MYINIVHLIEPQNTYVLIYLIVKVSVLNEAKAEKKKCIIFKFSSIFSSSEAWTLKLPQHIIRELKNYRKEPHEVVAGPETSKSECTVQFWKITGWPIPSGVFVDFFFFKCIIK